MEWLSALWAGFLFALACNLDTVLLALGYGAMGSHLGWGAALTLAGVTTAITLLSLLLGAAGAALLPAGLAAALGGLTLTAMGLWFLLDFLRGRTEEQPTAGRGWVALGAALAVNNAGVGVAVGASGVDPVCGAACNFFVTLLCLWAGHRLGREAALLKRFALPASGVLLVVLGLWQLFVS